MNRRWVALAALVVAAARALPGRENAAPSNQRRSVQGNFPVDLERFIVNPCSLSFDVIFVQDLTASFIPRVAFLESVFTDSAQSLEQWFPGSHFALASFRDKPLPDVGEPDDYCAKLHAPLGSLGPPFAFGARAAGGGGDLSDNSLEALARIVQTLSFRDNCSGPQRRLSEVAAQNPLLQQLRGQRPIDTPDLGILRSSNFKLHEIIPYLRGWVPFSKQILDQDISAGQSGATTDPLAATEINVIATEAVHDVSSSSSVFNLKEREFSGLNVLNKLENDGFDGTGVRSGRTGSYSTANETDDDSDGNEDDESASHGVFDAGEKQLCRLRLVILITDSLFHVQGDALRAVRAHNVALSGVAHPFPEPGRAYGSKDVGLNSRCATSEYLHFQRVQKVLDRAHANVLVLAAPNLDADQQGGASEDNGNSRKLIAKELNLDDTASFTQLYAAALGGTNATRRRQVKALHLRQDLSDLRDQVLRFARALSRQFCTTPPHGWSASPGSVNGSDRGSSREGIFSGPGGAWVDQNVLVDPGGPTEADVLRGQGVSIRLDGLGSGTVSAGYDQELSARHWSKLNFILYGCASVIVVYICYTVGLRFWKKSVASTTVKVDEVFSEGAAPPVKGESVLDLPIGPDTIDPISFSRYA